MEPVRGWGGSRCDDGDLPMKSYELTKSGALAEYDSRRADNPEFWDSVWKRKDLGGMLKKAGRGRLRGFGFLEKHLPRGCRILEAGCGTGQFVASLQALGYEVDGVDNAEEVIRAATSIAPHLRLRVADLRHLPFADGSFDAYLCFGVIEHFTDPEPVTEIIGEARRVTKGPILFTTPYFSALMRARYERGSLPARQAESSFYQHYFSKEQLEGILARNGLKVFAWSHYATVNGLVRHSPGFSGMYRWVPPFRLIAGRVPELLDRLAGARASHMLGAWCRADSRTA